jgi:hypothetical protein
MGLVRMRGSFLGKEFLAPWGIVVVGQHFVMWLE